MRIIKWDDSLKIGVESIDAQHQELIRIINEAIHLLESGHMDSRLIGTLHSLKEYTVYHFAEEESFMRQINYGMISSQLAAHKELKHTVSLFQSSLYHHESVDKDKAIHFIRHWLLDHILGEDMKIKAFLAERNRTHSAQPETQT